MLRIFGLQGSPTARLAVGAALIALGLWRHSTIAVVVGAGLLVATAVGAVNAWQSGRQGGQRQGGAR
jgi:hypothetical protein